jgi:hypothetical protein
MVSTQKADQGAVMNLHPNILLELSHQRQADLIAEAEEYHRVAEARHAVDGRKPARHARPDREATLDSRAAPHRHGVTAAARDSTPVSEPQPAATLAECVPAGAE